MFPLLYGTQIRQSGNLWERSLDFERKLPASCEPKLRQRLQDLGLEAWASGKAMANQTGTGKLAATKCNMKITSGSSETKNNKCHSGVTSCDHKEPHLLLPSCEYGQTWVAVKIMVRFLISRVP